MIRRYAEPTVCHRSDRLGGYVCTLADDYGEERVFCDQEEAEDAAEGARRGGVPAQVAFTRWVVSRPLDGGPTYVRNVGDPVWVVRWLGQRATERSYAN